MRRPLLLLLLAGCADAPRNGFESGNPVTAADLGPLPERVTAENARDVLRQCLQRHAVRVGDGTVVRYDFQWESLSDLYPSRTGFTRTVTYSADREDHESISFSGIVGVNVEAGDPARDTWWVRLRGGFSSGSGGSTSGWVLEGFSVPCADKETAVKLAAALRILSGRP